MSKRVEAEGSTAARICLIGEAPAQKELEQGRPFVGSAGKYLDNFLNMTGLYRGELYITNILKYRAPADKIANVPLDELRQGQMELIDEINSLEDVKIIVPLGKYAMETVTNKHGITNFRGSPLHPIEAIRHNAVVIPTFHPSKVHYEYRDTWPCIVADFGKVKRIKDNSYNFEFPAYNFCTQPTFEESIKTLRMLRDANFPMVVIDIENPHRLLSCIGLAWSRSDAISIPFYWGDGRNYWTSDEEFLIWKELGDVLPKLNLAGQNVMYDWEVMLNHHITLKTPYYDSMLMHACLYSELPHNLEFITSVYTDIPFYKRDEDEDTKRSSIRAGKERDHWIYNQTDCISTFWAIEELEAELVEEKMDGVYRELFAELIGIIFDMNMRGVPVDIGKLPAVREELNGAIADKMNKLTEELGYGINPNSYPQVRKALFEDLKMTPYRDKYGKVTTDKKALEKLAYKYNSGVPALISDIREGRSFVKMFDDENIEDGRFHTRYTLSVTRTGRLSSRKTASGKGRNLQNVKRGKARSFFIPEKGHIIIGADQKQAEARLTAYLSQDEAYIAAAESGELYFQVGKDVFKQEIAPDSKLYTISKSLVHGADYGIGPWGFAYAAGIPYSRAKAYLEEFHTVYPGIKNNYYTYVEECIRKTRTVYNAFGRRLIIFDYINDSAFRLGYAFYPQSTSGDITKFAMKRIAKYYEILMELHDGLYISVPTKEVNYGIEALKEAYNIKFKVWGIERTIPIDIKVGENWDAMKKVSI